MVAVTPPARRRVRPTQQWTVLGMAVLGLIFISMACIAGVVVMKSAGEDPPAGLIAIASAGVGALATLLTTSVGENK